MNSLFSFILVLGVLIFVHELGHFLFAKLFGVRVLTFSLGFGNKLISKKWGDTEYCLSAFPLGGYVKMFGEQPDEEIAEEEQAVSFTHKTVWQRFGIVLAGPLFNLIFAVFIFWLMFMFVEMPKPLAPVIDQVSAGSAAEKAGLQDGDTILKINGLKIKSWLQVPALVNSSEGREMTLGIKRNNKLLTVKVTPVLTQVDPSEEEKRYLLGIQNKGDLKFAKKNPFDALVAACVETWDTTVLTFNGIIMIFKKMIPASQIGGPTRIAEIAGQQLEAGWLSLISFTVLLSINLGILNLLPIPVLDGGHLVFLSIEAVRRKPLTEAALIRAQQVGISLLVALMFFAFYNDIARLIRHGWGGS
ncbi:MAG: RIP metalloprotease RseP [Candidatus Electrothrix sp. ATG2]|nr:RIP metalloprotease RseP [Candidatus Electrothrix sp. ATG2]